MNVLLVYPRLPVSYGRFQYGPCLINNRTALPPLGLITVAALLPSNCYVRLVDLNVDVLREDDFKWADFVLTGGHLIQAVSIHELILRAHAYQRPVAVGGPAPTTCPEIFGDADVVFQGEAEGRIDDLFRALSHSQRSGKRIVLEASSTHPDIKCVPVPRFELLDLSKYSSVSVQYSRGCSLQCEFCDDIEIFGSKPRIKTPDQMVVELNAIYRLGYKGPIYVVDDNFIGNISSVKRLLPIVEDWQRTRGHPFQFYTAANIDLASDPQLLCGMVDAGFSSVFLGIGTPSINALKQSKSPLNQHLDLSDAIDRITRAGLEVMCGLIVGFDSDGPDIFKLLREFIARQPIPLAMVGILTAIPGTSFWRRLKTEGRLREHSNRDPLHRPNFNPIINEWALLNGYAELVKWLYSPTEYYNRCEVYLSRVGTFSETRSSTLVNVSTFLNSIWRIGVLSPRRRLFWRLISKAIYRGRSHIRQAVTHAVLGESLILYTHEHLAPLMSQALAEIQAGIEHDSSSLPPACSDSPFSKDSMRLRSTGSELLPVVDHGKVHPPPNLSIEVD